MTPSTRRILNSSIAVIAVIAIIVIIIILRQRPTEIRPKPTAPNIIFILADDLGYGDLGCYGQKLIKTPSLDRMAAEGIRFTDFYTGSPLCAAARCTLMTGRHLGHAYVRANSPETSLRAQDVTIAELLRSAGYKTALIGKWGLGMAGTAGAPSKKGFEYSFGYLDHGEAHDYYPTHLWRNEKRAKVQSGSYSHDLFTEEALAFIREERDNRFFLYIPYTLPHGPFQIPSDEPYSNEPWTDGDKKLAAMITRLDRDVGRILTLLSDLGIDRETIVFFSSDNGPVEPGFFNSAGQLRGQKRNLYEGGIRVPMIVRWPGRIDPGQVSKQIWTFWDFLPTIAELTGFDAPAGTDGRSILAAILNGKPIEREPLYWERYLKDGRGIVQAVRLGRWKAVVSSLDNRLELYDLERDAAETTDTSDQNPQVVAEIRRIIKDSHSESEIWPSGLP